MKNITITFTKEEFVLLQMIIDLAWNKAGSDRDSNEAEIGRLFHKIRAIDICQFHKDNSVCVMCANFPIL